MATMTYANTAAGAAKAAGAKVGLFRRLIIAMQESRMRQAEIEIRRMRAITGDHDTGFKDALLPFRGE